MVCKIQLDFFSVKSFMKFLIILVFSSPEHKVLRVSYCDNAVSVMHRPSSVDIRCQLFGLCTL